METVMERKRTAVWAKIIAAILHYQNNHRGLSPTDEMIAIEAGLSREVVRSQIKEMEKERLLTDSRRWPRVIRVNKANSIETLLGIVDPKQEPPASQPVTKPVSRITQSPAWMGASEKQRQQWRSKGGKTRWAKLTPEQKKEAIAKLHANRWPKKKMSQVETKEEKEMEQNKRRETFKRMSFFDRAKQIAHIIDEYTDQHNGVPPSGMDIRMKIAEAYGFSADQIPRTSLLSSTSTRMIEEGWLDHEQHRHRDYRLTNLGRTTLLHSAPVKKEVMKAPISPPEPRTAPPPPPKPPEVTIRGIVPERPPEPPKEQVERFVAIPDLSRFDSMDLAIELQRRGFRVIR